MCAGALVNARIARVVYGCDDPKAGGVFSLYAIGKDLRLNHVFEVTRGVMAPAAASKLQDFFAQLRRSGKK
jgi:tRNA(adenine34) deaminase